MNLIIFLLDIELNLCGTFELFYNFIENVPINKSILIILLSGNCDIFRWLNSVITVSSVHWF